MARLTKKQQQQVNHAIDQLERFIEWVQSSRVQVSTEGLTKGEFRPICKQAGSPLQFTENALDDLKRLAAE